MPNNDLISRADVLDLVQSYGPATYDMPYGSGDMIIRPEDVMALPAVDAIPIAMLDKYENEPMLKTPIHLVKNIWQYERDKHIEGGKDNAGQ